MSADPLFDRLAQALAGRYTLVRELGRGGMATVYLATDVKLSRRVAIKVLPPTTRAYLGSGRFQREVLFAAQLSHPNIVPLFEADEADGLLFYVMEYVEGDSLKDRLARDGPLAVEEAIRIAAEVGDASSTHMRPAWCTATSSPATFCCPAGTPWSRISGSRRWSPKSAPSPTGPRSRVPASPSGPRST